MEKVKSLNYQNLNKDIMNKIINWFKERFNALSAILLVLLGVSLYFNFNPSTTPIIVEIPGKGGDVINPNPIPLPPRLNPKPEVIKITETITIPVENEVNLELLRELQKLVDSKDSLEILKRYIEAIKVNRYQEIVDNEDIRIESNLKTTGTLDSISTRYYIKSKQIIVDVPKPKAKVLAGLTVYNNFFEKPNVNFGGDISLQTKGNDIYSVGYNTRNEVYFQYKTTLFK